MRAEHWIYTLRLRLRSLFRRERLDQELDDELSDHIARKTEEYAAKGLPREEARAAALREFGGVEQAKEKCRDVRKVNWIADFAQDLQIGLRMLRKSPGFTAAAILTLALGIGANSAIFSVVEGVLLAPLPYAQPERLVMVLESNQIFPQDAISYPNFLDWQRTARSFEQMSAVMVAQGFDLTGPGTAEHVDGQALSSGFFHTLGVKLALGREFSPSEDRRGGARTAVISNRLWKNRFAGSFEALGKTVILGGVDYTIIGILPPGFRFLDEADVYVPVAQYDPLILDARGGHDSMVSIARLKPGVSIAQARAEMSAIQNHLDEIYPEADRGIGIDIGPLKQSIVGDVRGSLLMLLGAVGLVLLIACANVASLLLTRSTARTREFAIRAALGASRARLARQLLTESMILSLAGGAVGVAVAVGGIGPMLAAVPGTLPRSENIGVNAAVVWFAFGVSILVGILFGLLPAFRISRIDLQASLKEGGRGSTTAHHRALSTLAIVQMALTLVLLMGAGLLFRTIRQLWKIDPGFDTEHVLTFKASLSPSAMKSGAEIRNGFLQMMERIRSIAGVRAADFTLLVPLTSEDNEAPFWIDSQKPAVPQNAARMVVFDTGPDYLRTMGIPLLQGRFFTAEDNTNSACVGVIDSVLAQTFFPGENPVGKTMTFGWPAAPWGPCAIIGVVGHVNHWGLGEPGTNTKAQSYYPMLQASDKLWPLAYPYLQIVVRTAADAASVMPAIKAAVYAADGSQPVYDVRTMQEIVAESMSTQRFPMVLLGAFAGLALLLASVGIYGVISYSVTLRVHEIGIRMALGAEKRDVFRMIVVQGLRLAAVGLAIGTVAALVLARVLASFSHLLYGVGTSDPATFLAVSALLTAVVIFACSIPARRAMRVDPMVALRYE